MTMEKNALAHDDGTGWIGTEGGNRVVSIVIVESGE